MKWVWLIGGEGDLKIYRSSYPESLSLFVAIRQADIISMSPKWPLNEPISLKTTLFLPKDYLGKL